MARLHLPDLFRKATSTAHKMQGYFADDPIDVFHEHVWINPFWEDDVYQVADLMGADRVIFGSDWPHIEALPEPRDYLPRAEGLRRRRSQEDPARQRPRAEHPSPDLTLATARDGRRSWR